MLKKYSKIIFVFLAVLVLSAIIVTSADATESVTIEGNAAGSQNSATINTQNQTTINQQNTANVDNDVNVNCDTGNNNSNQNTANGASTATGDCQANVNVSTQLNTNQAQVSCPNCPKASLTPKPGESPTVQQPPVGGGGGGNGGGGGGGNGGGQGGTSSSPQVLGAAGVAADLISAMTGFGLILLGLYTLARNLRFADLASHRP